MKLEFKQKLFVKATIAGVLDVLALGLLSYFAFKTLNIVLLALLACVAIIFMYDLKHAVQFIARLIKNN